MHDHPTSDHSGHDMSNMAASATHLPHRLLHRRILGLILATVLGWGKRHDTAVAIALAFASATPCPPCPCCAPA
ncbi:hypothetical protein QJS66_13990 [Kocuria rhizophila]|nr:hypothetical protein QJS66_13990 [Kocuria rhizophila]